MVTEIEKFAGAIFVTVIFTEPCPEACAVSCKLLGTLYGIDGALLERLTEKGDISRNTRTVIPRFLLVQMKALGDVLGYRSGAEDHRTNSHF